MMQRKKPVLRIWFRVKNTVLKFFDADPDPGSGNFYTEIRGKNSDPGSGINIPDPQP
jgi:hypothetical protein